MPPQTLSISGLEPLFVTGAVIALSCCAGAVFLRAMALSWASLLRAVAAPPGAVTFLAWPARALTPSSWTPTLNLSSWALTPPSWAPTLNRSSWALTPSSWAPALNRSSRALTPSSGATAQSPLADWAVAFAGASHCVPTWSMPVSSRTSISPPWAEPPLADGAVTSAILSTRAGAMSPV